MAQAKSKTSSAFDEINTFSHLYDRGVGLVNGKPSPRDSQFEHGTADTHVHIRLQSPKAKK